MTDASVFGATDVLDDDEASRQNAEENLVKELVVRLLRPIPEKDRGAGYWIFVEPHEQKLSISVLCEAKARLRKEGWILELELGGDAGPRFELTRRDS